MNESWLRWGWKFLAIMGFVALLTFILVHEPAVPNPSPIAPKPWQATLDIEILPKFDDLESLFDSTRTYKQKPFVFVGEHWANLSRTFGMCLATHSSYDSLDQLPGLAQSWRGPISLVLFTPGPHFAFARVYLKYLASCFLSEFKQIAIHLVFPSDLPIDRTSTLNLTYNCLRPQVVKKHILDWASATMGKKYIRLPYPQSKLRNLGLTSCQNPYTLSLDIDMRIPEGHSEAMEQFLATKAPACPKCIFILPVYEVNMKVENTKIPKNKSQLLPQIYSRSIRRYHEKTFKYGQAMSDLDAWEALNESLHVLDIAYELEKYQFLYEPMFIGPSSMPKYDERFNGFGFCRNTHVYELFVAGYRFHVMNQAFMIHLGFKIPGARPNWTRKELMTNDKLVGQFGREVKAKYGRDPCGMSLKLTTFSFAYYRTIFCPFPNATQP